MREPKNPRFFTAVEATWDILQSFATLDGAKRAIERYLRNDARQGIHEQDYYTILCKDRNGFFVPACYFYEELHI